MNEIKEEFNMRFYGFAAGESQLASLLPAILDSNFHTSNAGPVNPTFVLKKEDNSVFSKLVHLSVLPVEVRNYQVEQPVKLKFHNDLFDR